MHFLGHSQII